QRSPVSVVDNALDIGIGFLLSRAADDANGRPDLDVATTLTRQALRLRDALDTGFGRVHAIEVHIRVTDGKLAAGRGAAGVHHQRRVSSVGSWGSFHATKLVVHARVVERSCAGPDPLDDAPPFFALRVALVVLVLCD